MKTSEALKLIKDAVEDVESKGQALIATANLKKLLDEMIGDANKIEAGVITKTDEQIAREIEVWKTQTTATASVSAEMLKATIEAGQTALKSAILINGGAAVTILAFIGNAVTKWKFEPGSALLTAVGFALFTFVVGTGLAGASTAFRYLSQFSYGTAFDTDDKRWRSWGDRANLVAVAFGSASFAAFFIGCYQAFRAIINP